MIKRVQRISRDEKTQLAYLILGVNADTAQLGRAYLRYDYDGCVKNIDRMMKKLSEVRKVMKYKHTHKGGKSA